MSRATISKIVKGLIPRNIRRVLFPVKQRLHNLDNEFITVSDPIAGNSFKAFIRQDSVIESIIYLKGLYGEWEKESLKIWAELSKISNTIVDIGANTGIYTLLAENNNPNAMVIAIEPIEMNFNVLTKNIVENNFKARTEKIALSDKEGFASMFMIKDHLNYMTSINNNRYNEHPEIQGDNDVVEVKVPMKTFDFISNKYDLKAIDLIKIDVEGYEIQVLNSMLAIIRESRPVILVEVIGNENAKAVNNMFIDLNYKFVSINERSLSKVVDSVWDNDHHNFLLCHDSTINYLREKGLLS